MSIQYRDENGEVHDALVHRDILEGVNFNRTPAYKDALERLINLGFSEEEARELLKEA